jgi:hypothetical protein
MVESEVTVVIEETAKIEEKIQIIMRQTDLCEDDARAKLTAHNYDHMKVIREHLGIAEKKAPTSVKSVNQEIYRQFRENLKGAGAEIVK